MLTHKFTIIDDYGRNTRKRIVKELSHEPDEVGAMAAALVAEWGKVPFRTDGEDSAGRQKGAVLEPHEIVDRAITAAEHFYAQLFERGHMRELPPMNYAIEDT